MTADERATGEWLASLEDGHARASDAADLRAIGEALNALDAAVTAARHAGRTWTEIAGVLGTSRQAARQRFAGTTGN